VQKNVLLNGVDSSTENTRSFHAIFQKILVAPFAVKKRSYGPLGRKNFRQQEHLALHLRVILWYRRVEAVRLAILFDAFDGADGSPIFS
jgi:hypothetical protein